MKKFYIKTKLIKELYSPSDPDGDLGFDHNIHEDLVNDQEGWIEGVLVNIDDVIDKLQDLKSSGANYVDIYPHEDHRELEIRGFEIRTLTDDEIQKIVDAENLKEKQRRESEIKRLEEKLEKLKNQNI